MKTAIFSGSFDPVTLGHLDVIERVSGLFDQVVVLVSNSNSKSPLFSAEERKDLIEKACKGMKNVKVEINSGLTVEALKKFESAVLVRSLRGLSDFDHERSIAEANRLLDSSVETFFLFCRPDLIGVSSSLVREIARHGGALNRFVPPHVEKSIKSKMRSKK